MANKMQPDEFKSLRALVDEIALRDVHVGRALQQIVYHLGQAHGLDAAEEDAKAEKQAKAEADRQAKQEASAQPKASAKKEG